MDRGASGETVERGAGEAVLRLDPAARGKLAELRDSGRFEGSALRVSCREEGAAFRYQLEVVAGAAAGPEDTAYRDEGILFLVDAGSAVHLRGATLQYVDGLSGSGFRFANPNRPKLLQNPLAERVQEILDEQINPGVAAHGGRVDLVDVQGGRVFVRFGGGCQGCGMVDVTLKEGVVGALQRALPEIEEVLDATDHEAGENPYYSSDA